MILSFKNLVQDFANPRLWAIPWLLSVIYPGVLLVFSRLLVLARDNGNPLLYGTAVIVMGMAFLSPLLALGILLHMTKSAGRLPPVRKVRLLHLIVATPPLYVLLFVILNNLGQLPWLIPVWVTLWLGGGIFTWWRQGEPEPGKRRNNPAALKRIHGYTAMLVLATFLILHLANQATAFWSVESHAGLMTLLRGWYRVLPVEAALLFVFAVLAFSGIALFLHHTRVLNNKFRVLQTTSGTYLAAFLCAHVYAVMGARLNGVDTNWYFATGPAGLLQTNSMLIPYYTLAVFLLMAHLGLAARLFLLTRQSDQAYADRALHFIAGTGGFLTLVIMIAALGFGVANFTG